MSSIPNKYNMIVAVDENWCIGNKGNLLVYLPEDMKYFKAITTNRVVVMGKNTQNSLPFKGLKDRINIVLTSTHTNPGYIYRYKDRVIVYTSGIDCIPSLIKEINEANMSDKLDNRYITDGDVFIIGGGQIYKEFLENDLIDTIYLTKIHHKYEGDTFIPNLYDLGFKDFDIVVPETVNINGIKYSISILKK